MQNGICKYLVSTFLHFTALRSGFPFANLYLGLQHFTPASILTTRTLSVVCGTGQTGGGSGQHGGRAATGRVQADRRLRPALGADAPLPLSLLPQPAGSAHHPAG